MSAFGSLDVILDRDGFGGLNFNPTNPNGKETKGILYVKEFLGHRRLDSTLLYINIEKALFHEANPEEFHVKIAQTPKEMKGLLEVGFEYVCEKDGLLFFRKRK